MNFSYFATFVLKIRYIYHYSLEERMLALERDGDWGKKKENVI